ncbi:MAG: RimK/LysX family protein [Leptospiraceae bacterium]|nr:RimK/LysX family protein [Leptospiraceae bacterium]
MRIKNKIIQYFSIFLLSNCSLLHFTREEPQAVEKKVVIIQTQYPKPIVGRVEWIDLPDFQLKIRSRIDTGAKSCSLHATNIVPEKEGDALFVNYDSIGNDGKPVRLRSKVLYESKVTSTNGKTESRYVIRAKVKLGKVSEIVNVNLNDRTNLTYNFLVGRNLLMGNFVVDVSSSHVLGD